MARRQASIADVDDSTALAMLGHQAELHRSFSPLAMLGLAFAILNSWTALSASLSVALPSGGPTSVIWGLVTAGVFNLCLAASLAEFLSAFPTAAGQLHWVAVVSPKSWSAVLSYFTGWINVGGWLALTATGGLLGSQFILEIIALLHPDYEEEAWHQFLIYIAFNIGAFLINAFANSKLPILDRGAIFWSIGGFVIISITILATASPNYNSGDLVFRQFTNETGWPDGLAWLLGLLQGGFGLTGFDAVAHMIEEIPNPTITGPKIMIYCVCIGIGSGLVFLICLLFVAGDLEDVRTAAEGPLLHIFYNATSSYAGSVCLLMFPIVCQVFATVAIMTTSSRMTWAFARDHGMPFEGILGKVNQRLGVPLNSLIFTFIVVVIFGCIFLGSSAAFNAITAASVIALGISYGMPIFINLCYFRHRLPETRAFKLPEWLGWIVNILGVAYVLFTTVLFFFPPTYPTTGETMNYAIAAFGIWMLIAVVSWFVVGKRRFTGPVTDLMEGNVLTAVGSLPLGEKIGDHGVPGVGGEKGRREDGETTGNGHGHAKYA